jgi:GDP-4-dehydro-6-deoxy-D-mannose reductase
MRALVTGCNGFVGQHLSNFLIEQGIEVWGTTREKDNQISINNVHYVHCEFKSSTEVEGLLSNIRPDYLFHLAGQSSVSLSWKEKANTFHTNVINTIILFDAVKKYNCPLRVISVGSSEEYGYYEGIEMPIREQSQLQPLSPYGASKATVSMLVRQYYTTYKLEIIHARPFNHIGPGQSLGFVVPDFSSQIINNTKGFIEVGNLSAARDFTDVRDIVRGYWILANSGKPGEAYNLCSNKTIKIQDVLNKIINVSKKEIKVIQDPNRLRPSDIPIYYGSYDKISKLGWEPKIPLQQSIDDVYKDWLNKLQN